MDLGRLRDYVLTESRRAGLLRTSDLYRRAGAASVTQPNGKAVVSRPQFYRWFGSARTAPDSGLLALIPGLARALAVPEVRLLAEAGFQEPDQAPAHSVDLQRELRSLREHLKSLTTMLNQSSYTEQAEALVVDRILRARLDYQIGVWPVVRGSSLPMQLRSWISLRSISTRSLRPETTRLQALAIAARRAEIRGEIISDELWSLLGLRWRVERPVEWPKKEDSPLRIELPIDERNQQASAAAFDLPQPLASRILVVSGLWGHAETLSALLATALQWRSIDLRYMGFRDEYRESRDLVRSELTSDQAHLVWSIAQRARSFSALRSRLDAVPNQPIVLITYGTAVMTLAAKAFRRTATRADIAESQERAVEMAMRLNQRMPVIHVKLADADVRIGRARVDVDLVVDHIRYSVMVILLLMRVHLGGPPPQMWRSRTRFKDATDVLKVSRASRVEWHQPGEFTAAIARIKSRT